MPAAHPTMMLGILREHLVFLEQEKRRLRKQIESIDQEQEALRTVISHEERRQQDMKSPDPKQRELDLDILPGDGVVDAPVSTPAPPTLRPKAFPSGGTWKQKILFVIRTADRFLHNSEIVEMLASFGAEINPNTLSAYLYKLKNRADLRRVNYNGAARMTFYGLDYMVKEENGVQTFGDAKYKPIGSEMEPANENSAVFD